MLSSDLKAYLEARRKVLINELDNIEELLGCASNKSLEGSFVDLEDGFRYETFASKKIFKSFNPSDYGLKVPKKGNSETWKNYIFKILEMLGSKRKTKEIVDVILKANPDITLNRAKQVTADKLLELVNDKTVKVTKGGSKKEGYIYEVMNNIY